MVVASTIVGPEPLYEGAYPVGEIGQRVYFYTWVAAQSLDCIFYGLVGYLHFVFPFMKVLLCSIIYLDGCVRRTDVILKTYLRNKACFIANFLEKR
jgi:hypothetical protein